MIRSLVLSFFPCCLPSLGASILDNLTPRLDTDVCVWIRGECFVKRAGCCLALPCPSSLDNVCAEPNPSDARYLDGLHKTYARHMDFPRTQPKDMVRVLPFLRPCLFSATYETATIETSQGRIRWREGMFCLIGRVPIPRSDTRPSVYKLIRSSFFLLFLSGSGELVGSR